MTEKWKPISGYPMYDVSSYGRVRSWTDNKQRRLKDPHLLSPGLDGHGYPMVVLCANGRSKSLGIHRLVLTAFVGPRPPGKECCHADGSRTNNRLNNLRWDTRTANILDAVAHGTWTQVPPVHWGEAHSQAKLTDAKVFRIRQLYAQGGITHRELGKQFGVGRSTISHIIRRETWTAHHP